MRCGVPAYNSALLLLVAPSWPLLCAAAPWTGLLSRRQLLLDYSPAPPPEEGPPASAGALRDPAYLPAQIGGIVGAYALSLVLVALFLLAFSRRRREHLRNRDRDQDDVYFEFNPFPEPFQLESEEEYKRQLEQFQLEQFQLEQLRHFQFDHAQNERIQKLSLQTDFPRSPVRNFSLPASASPLSPGRYGPLSPSKSHRSAFTESSPTSTVLAAGIDLSVDQSIVNRDRAMAQQQLEEMYKHVMELERAKEEGREYQGPPIPAPPSASASASPAKAGTTKKGRNKPSNLNLAQDDKSQSRSSSIFSFLKSPRKNKAPSGLNISSPIMTPMSGTFPRHDDQEMNAIPPRHYAPPAPPPVPSDLPFRRAATASAAGSSHLPTPDISPVSTQSIDSRIDAAIGQPPSRAARREQRGRETRSDDRLPAHSRDVSTATSTAGEYEPVSAVSENSTTALVGLPQSPRPGVNRFPSLDSLPASPRPGQQTFAHSSTSSFPKQASAVREAGALPLRAYEPSVSSPTASSFATKQTVFTRAAPGPLSPGLPTGMRTPWTGAPVPYTPYQPFSPVVPITPTVVTRADRKRMKKFEPKTPTVEMVKSSDEIW